LRVVDSKTAVAAPAAPAAAFVDGLAVTPPGCVQPSPAELIKHARKLIRDGNPEAARILLERGLEARRAAGPQAKEDVARLLSELAGTLREQNDPQKALAFARAASTMLRLGNPEARAYALFQAALALRSMPDCRGRNLDEAASLLTKAIAICSSDRLDHRMLAIYRRELAMTLEDVSRVR
jgi:hypothetical protein